MQPGQIIAERFSLERQVDAGGMGTIWRAFDLQSERPVAFKVALPGAQPERFRREIATLLRIDHPGIVRYVAHGLLAGGERYLAMEWLEGEDLEHRLRRGALSIDDTIELARQVAAALEVVHAAGLVHRDLKPANLFLVNGDPKRVRLIDFGIVQDAEATRGGLLTKTGTTIGTPGYMAPEQARADATLDARADLFSLGAVLYECLAGRPLFTADSPIAILAKVLLEPIPSVNAALPGTPAPLAAIIDALLERDPAWRPRGAARVSHALSGGWQANESPATQRSFTAAEQSLCSVVLVRLFESGKPVTGDAPTLASDASGIPTVQRHIEKYGGLAHVLVGDVVVGEFRGGTDGIEETIRAAQCALACADVQHAAVALSRVWSESASLNAVGPALERAAKGLADAPSDAVWLDEKMAGLLRSRMTVAERNGHLHLLSGSPSSASSPTRTFLGRRRELALLTGTAEECTEEGIARALLVEGEVGMGKSMLSDEFLRDPQVGEAFVSFRICGQPGAEPFGALREWAQFLSVGLNDSDLTVAGAHTAADDVAGERGAFLRELLHPKGSGPQSAPSPSSEPPQLALARRDARLMNDRVTDAIVALIEAKLRQRPLLLVIDDAQWLDRGTSSVIATALRQLADRAWLVVAFGTASMAQQLGDWEGLPPIRAALGPLGKSSVSKLIDRALPSATDHQRAAIVERADGNPLFVDELCRHIAEGGDVQNLPDTIAGFMAARLSGLTPAERRTLRAASVFGIEFDAAPVAGILDVDESAVSATLSDLASRGWVVPRALTASVYQFRNRLLTDIAYATLPSDEQRRGHAAAAEWLAAHQPDAAFSIFDHFARAESDDAPRWGARAAASALTSGDLSQCLAIVDRTRSIDAPSEPALAISLATTAAEAARWAGNVKRCWDEASAVLQIAELRSRVWYRALVQTAVPAVQLGKREALLQLSPDLENEWPNPPTIDATLAAARMATALKFLGEVDASKRLIALLPAHVDDPLVAAAVYIARGMDQFRGGDMGEAADLLSAAAEAFQRAGDQRNACQAAINGAHCRFELGGYAGLESVLRGAIAIAERMGINAVRASGTNNLGSVLALLGRLDEAESLKRSAIEMLTEQGNQRLEGGTRTMLAQLLLARNAVDEAQSEAKRAVACLRDVPPLLAEAKAVLAAAHLRSGHSNEARTVIDEALQLVRQDVTEQGEPKVFAIAVSVYGHQKDLAATQALRDEARHRIHLRATAIKSEAWRQTFLSAYPEGLAKPLEQTG